MPGLRSPVFTLLARRPEFAKGLERLFETERADFASQTMNDPHIEALHYSVRHAEDVDYDKAGPLSHDTPGFTVRVENGHAEVTMKSHHSSVETARSEVEPFLRAWELTAALQFRPGDFEFLYARATIMDRNPTPGGISFAALGDFSAAADVFEAHVERSKYPDPPTKKLARDDGVELMFTIYCRYCAGRTQLGVAADYCLGMLKLASGSLDGAARHYAVSLKVLRRLGTLASHKGGVEEGRKPDVAKSPYTAIERHWLEETIKRLIGRAAEVAGDPSVSLQTITMADLPRLP